jgi:hypothetical protein
MSENLSGGRMCAPERVEHRAALLALAVNRVVLHLSEIVQRLDWRVHARERNDETRGLEASRWPHIPREAHGVALLGFEEVHGAVLTEMNGGIVEPTVRQSDAGSGGDFERLAALYMCLAAGISALAC